MSFFVVHYGTDSYCVIKKACISLAIGPENRNPHRLARHFDQREKSKSREQDFPISASHLFSK